MSPTCSRGQRHHSSHHHLREGVDKPMDFTLVRDEIPRYSVDVHFLIRPGIGYMHVYGFNETTEARSCGGSGSNLAI